MELPKTYKQEMQYLSLDEQKHLTSAAQNHPLGMIVILALAIGMRKGELLTLTWNDIDFDKNTLYVWHTLSHLTNCDGETKTSIVIGEPKTQSAELEILFSKKIAKQLRQHKKTQLENKLKAGKLYQDNNFVFCNELRY